MGFWDNVKAAVSRKKRSGTGLELSKWQTAPPRRGSRELLVAYREMPWLRTCTDTVSDAVACVSWRMFKRVDKGGKSRKDFSLRSAPKEIRTERIKSLLTSGEVVEVHDHWALNLLANPSDYLTGRSIIKLIQTHLDLVGEAFLVLDKVGSLVLGFWPLPPHLVTRIPNLSDPKENRFFEVTTIKGVKLIPASDVIHLRALDPEDPMGRGVGPAFALGDELDSDEYIARFIKNTFWNNALPPAIVSLDGAGDSGSGAKRFKEELVRDHKGPDKAGKILVTNGKVTFARLDTPFKDMQLVELRKFLNNFVRMTYRIPPEIVGDISSSNKATAFAARENLAEQATLPRMEFLRTEFQMRLLGDEDVILDYESPVPADREHQLRVMGTLPEAFSYDEWREVAGYKPDANRVGYPMPMPGQKPGGQQTPAPTDGSSAEQEQGKLIAGDPPWAKEPLK